MTAPVSKGEYRRGNPNSTKTKAAAIVTRTATARTVKGIESEMEATCLPANVPTTSLKCSTVPKRLVLVCKHRSSVVLMASDLNTKQKFVDTKKLF